MKYYLLVSFILLFTMNLQAQPDPRPITVTDNGQVNVPADILLFQIEIIAESPSPEEAFEKHEKLEERLMELLNEHQVEDNRIYYDPISIERDRRVNQNDNSETITSQTHQWIQLTLDDFVLFESLQVELIAAGFTEFEAIFDASDTKDASEEALRRAVDNARRKAEIMAERVGGEVGEVLEMTYGKPVSERFVVSGYGTRSIMDIEQHVTVTHEVTVTFALHL